MAAARQAGGWLRALLITLFWHVSSWLLSLPAWITLALHFVIGLPLWWFWATLGAWLAAGLVRFLLVNFARWGAGQPDPPKPNKNPYSAGK